MEGNISSPESLPHDIRTDLQNHDVVLRLSYTEIVSGINRLLRLRVPKEVISEVVMRAVEAVSRDFDPSPYQNLSPPIGSQLDDSEP